ncbi:uncharacterized protein PADG_07778 [Paracoccidioides brasiliensis Pb18]|uniref:DUF7729 domain-containing protein n=1 Tax=Paracoccidioides brasiliensis (strain Pb18) TaxID=502780 RepID=C1GKJ2_PARBD|nr:uncharacterized protein PADG_07778 [Paracoccidioides brasiliensis Pb18]EEH42958.1 hypothetical protein PADG_07778 [Paracoccidioides brasiliensis Pb18]
MPQSPAKQQGVNVNQFVEVPGANHHVDYSLMANKNGGGDLREIFVDLHTIPAEPRSEVPLQRRGDPQNRAKARAIEGSSSTSIVSSTTKGSSTSSEPRKSSSSSTSVSASVSTSTSDPTTKYTGPTKTDSPTEKTDSPTPTGSGNDIPLPSPFDSNLGSNFTNPACPIFFQDFLTNASFQNCYPVSLLLQSSLSFFEASRSVARLSRILDAACSAPRDDCKAIMSDLAAKLTSKEVCGEDFRLQQPIVIQAHNGLRAYTAVYDAMCLKSPDTHNYCFSDAVVNGTNPSNSFIYYLPLGMNLPGSSRPTCNKCLQATMQSFSRAATTDNQPIVKTYMPAANQININCGPAFVVSAVKVGKDTGAGSTTRMVKGTSLLRIMGYMILFCVGMPLLGGLL